MRLRRTSAQPDFETFVSRNAGPTLVSAYLLTGEWDGADDAAARALASAGRRADAMTAADGGERAALVALARAHARRRGLRWDSRGGLRLQEREAGLEAEVPDDDAMRAALAQLTEQERAAIVLRHHGGLDLPSVAEALGLPEARVAATLGLASRVLDERRPAAGGGEVGELGSDLGAFFTAHRELAPQTDRVRRLAAEHDRGARRMRGAAVVAAAAGALAAVFVGVAALQSAEQPAASAPLGTETSPPPWALSPRGPAGVLPAAKPGMKLVGFDGMMLSVPSSWVQRSGACSSATRDAVLFLRGSGNALCGDGDTPPGLSVVAFSEEDIGFEPGAHGARQRERSVAGQFVVTPPAEPGGRYVAYSTAPSLGFGMSVTTPSLRTLNQIIGSIRTIPVGYAAMPQCLGLSPQRVDQIVYARGLVPLRMYDPGGVGLPSHVVQQSQSVGTILPTQTRVTLGLLPR